MSRPANAKYCPRCTTMNFADAETCRHCQHQFRTGQTTATPDDDDLHRTQMFSLPPLPQRSTLDAARPGDSLAHARFWTAIRAAIRSPLVLAAGAVIAVIAAIVVAAAAFGVIGR